MPRLPPRRPNPTAKAVRHRLQRTTNSAALQEEIDTLTQRLNDEAEATKTARKDAATLKAERDSLERRIRVLEDSLSDRDARLAEVQRSLSAAQAAETKAVEARTALAADLKRAQRTAAESHEAMERATRERDEAIAQYRRLQQIEGARQDAVADLKAEQQRMSEAVRATVKQQLAQVQQQYQASMLQQLMGQVTSLQTEVQQLRGDNGAARARGEGGGEAEGASASAVPPPSPTDNAAVRAAVKDRTFKLSELGISSTTEPFYAEGPVKLVRGSLQLSRLGRVDATFEVSSVDVVVKQYQATMLSAPLLRALKREQCLYTMLTHPNLVQVYGVVKKPPSIVMEDCRLLVDEQNVNDLRGLLHLIGCAQGDSDDDEDDDEDEAAKVTPHDLVRLARQAALGLAELHSRGIVHRDIKGGNVMLQGTDSVSTAVAKIGDFGSAINTARTLCSQLSTSTLRPGTQQDQHQQHRSVDSVCLVSNACSIVSYHMTRQGQENVADRAR